MTIAVGDKLPEAELMHMGAEGPAAVALGERLAGRKVVVFGVPGAFTPTCHQAHLPSFIRTKDAFAEKGVDEIICVAVNDPFVLQAWAQATGADTAGISVLGDPQSHFVSALGLAFDAPPVGLMGRAKRFAMIVEDGTVTALSVEDNPGACDVSAGEALLAQA